ncbi:hypothetical protein Tco_1214550 [Tanacetum coccineum]
MLWRRGFVMCVVVNVTNKGWVDGNGSNLGGGFGKPGGGRETRGGGDGLERFGGANYPGFWLILCRISSNRTREKDLVLSLSLNDEDEEMTEGEVGQWLEDLFGGCDEKEDKKHGKMAWSFVFSL